jgi:hypothetical protein
MQWYSLREPARPPSWWRHPVLRFRYWQDMRLLARRFREAQAANPRVRLLFSPTDGCQEPTCPDYGRADFGEGTCPESHADIRGSTREDTDG